MKITWKMWLMFSFLFVSLLAIFVNSDGITLFQSGLLVNDLAENSSLSEAGLKTGSTIKSINGQEINSLSDYTSAISSYSALNENETKKIEITLKNSNSILALVDKNVVNDISVSEIKKTRIKTGLDIDGGARALVASDRPLTESELDDLIAVSQERLNLYGLLDLSIKKQSDSSGNRYMVIEIAGSSPNDLEELIAKQGKFEAKIGNDTVFIGGDRDITSVGRTASDGAVVYDCRDSTSQSICYFRFPISLSEAATKRHAEITGNLTVNGSYLSKQLDFFIDGQKTSSLNIGTGLKGRVETQIQISGSGVGATRQEALDNAKAEMKKLQTILITGSLPFKLEIVKIDRISPFLGAQFMKTIFIASLVAFASVCIIIFIRYRKIKLSLIMLGVAFSEIVMILGFSTLIGANLDLASIAGIIAAIGTGINDQQVIVEETTRGRKDPLKVRIKNALFIVFTSFATIVASLFPLLYAGAGLLRGFATTTIIGITLGVLITRPAFADMINQLDQ